MDKRLTRQEMADLHPGKWIFVGNAESNGSEVLSGEVIRVCDDSEYVDTLMDLVNSGISFRRFRASLSYL